MLSSLMLIVKRLKTGEMRVYALLKCTVDMSNIFLFFFFLFSFLTSFDAAAIKSESSIKAVKALSILKLTTRTNEREFESHYSEDRK